RVHRQGSARQAWWTHPRGQTSGMEGTARPRWPLQDARAVASAVQGTRHPAGANRGDVLTKRRPRLGRGVCPGACWVSEGEGVRPRLGAVERRRRRAGGGEVTEGNVHFLGAAARLLGLFAW